jgi:hypothetical protein
MPRQQGESTEVFLVRYVCFATAEHRSWRVDQPGNERGWRCLGERILDRGSSKRTDRGECGYFSDRINYGGRCGGAAEFRTSTERDYRTDDNGGRNNDNDNFSGKSGFGGGQHVSASCWASYSASYSASGSASRRDCARRALIAAGAGARKWQPRPGPPLFFPAG